MDGTDIHLQLIRPTFSQYHPNVLSLPISQGVWEIHIKSYIQIAVSTVSSTGHAFARHSHDMVTFGNTINVDHKFVSIQMSKFVFKTSLKRAR